MYIFKYKPILLFSFLTCSLYAQENQKTTVDTTKLSEVVITGQFEPQSLKKSVFNVRVIKREDIERRAANNLADVLNQYLNITVRPSGTDGRSTVSMFGLDGQYFKILMDNVPIVSDSGLGSNIDLTQINLDDVERIEIIEGSMGVTHGANAVTGILNIITKKGSKKKYEVSATVQEETVGNEYGIFNKGRHIQAFKASYNINSNLYVSVGANRNDFAGFFDDKRGKNYRVNDSLRGYSWLPKQQLITNALVSYTKGTFRAFYKFDYFNENVDYYSPIVIPIDNYPFDPTYYSRDIRYRTNRNFHLLNASGHLFSQLAFTVSASYQKQQRDQERFNYYILSSQEQQNKTITYLSREVLYSTGSVSNFFKDKRYDLQLGYEAVNEKGFASPASGTFRDEEQLGGVNRTLENYDFYASAEIKCTDRFSLRPGYRHSFQSIFEDQNALSVGARYLFGEGLEARASVGKSYRTPNFDELYSYFVDSNHNVQGNDALIPERSLSYEGSLKKETFFASGLKLNNNLIASYIEVDDRISLILTSVTPSFAYKYMNVDKYKIVNIATSHQLAYKNLEASAGLSLVGVSQLLDAGALDSISNSDFLYVLNGNASVGYNVPKWNTLFSLYYKYTGREQLYQQNTDVNNNVTYSKAIIDGYSMLDASVKTSFLDKKLDLTFGARNLLNMKNINSTAGGNVGGAHSGGGGNMLLAYGTSFFAKLTYNINFN